MNSMTAHSDSYRPVVLVVDDETVIADTLAVILKKSGYNAISVYDAESALEAAMETPPEVLISDIVLPGMNGIELAVRLQRIFPDCKMILSSGQSASKHLLAMAGDAAHQFEFLHKPVRPEILLENVSRNIKPRTAVAAG